MTQVVRRYLVQLLVLNHFCNGACVYMVLVLPRVACLLLVVSVVAILLCYS